MLIIGSFNPVGATFCMYLYIRGVILLILAAVEEGMGVCKFHTRHIGICEVKRLLTGQDQYRGLCHGSFIDVTNTPLSTECFVLSLR